MSEIADGAGLQQSSIYYYFRNKEEILRDIVVNVNRIPLAFLARINAEGGSAGVRLFRLVRFDTETLCSFPYDINEIHRLSAQDPETFAGVLDRAPSPERRRRAGRTRWGGGG